MTKGEKEQAEWKQRFEAYAQAYPDVAKEFNQIMRNELPSGWDADVPTFPADMSKGVATRVASGQVLNAIAKHIPNLMGGSADLDPSTKTELKGMGDFEPPDTQGMDLQGSVGGGWSYAGRNVHYGVREHAMGAAANGLAVHGGILPFTATFLTFSDYMRPAIRLAAVMQAHVILVFTHDSIGLGEDGPTHQPIEQLAALRAIPQLVVIRPADANETAVAWKVAVERQGPVLLAFTRQNVPVFDRGKYASAEGLRRGAYILADAPNGRPDVILIATGSEVQLIVGAQAKLQEQGMNTRLVSMPSWELFDAQSKEYRESVLLPNVKARVAVEAGVAEGWRKYVGDAGDIIAMDGYGASAPYKVVFEKFGFTVDNVVEHARKLVKK